MTAIAVHHTDTNDTRAWDGPGEEAKLDTPITKSAGQGMYAWYDPEATDDNGDGFPDVKSGYKFPHHFVTDGKPGEASINGVNAAKQRLSSADIPANERPAVEKHLNAHRKDAGLEDEADDGARMRQPIRIVEGTAKPHEAFWLMRPAAEGQPAEIDFFGYISEFSWLGDEITPQQFKQDLTRVGQGGPITIRIHGGGGDIFAAAAIRAMLMDYPGRKTVKIMGLAASAAVAIALAGDEIQIFDTAYMMIHNPGYQLLIGWITAEVMRKWASELELFSEGLINAYAGRTGLERPAIQQMMDAETWMTAQQAVELGFADKIVTGEKAPAQITASTLQGFAHVPAVLINSVNSGQAPVVKQASPQMQAHRARLEAAKNQQPGGTTMSAVLRNMLAQRAELVAQAQQIIDKAEAEERELTPEESMTYVELLGEGETGGQIGELDSQIAVEIDRRARLRKAAETKFTLPGTEPVKPDGGKPNALKRADFDKLTHAEQTAFLKAGGKLED